jgi:magnesium/proton exchanger
MEWSSTMNDLGKDTREDTSWLSLWWQQFVDAFMVT